MTIKSIVILLNNIILLIETNGVYADTKRLKKLLDDIGDNSVAALWDTHHPYRYFNETPADTVANIGEYIKYAHIKDSVMVDGAVKYKMMGEGDIPVKEIIEELKSLIKTINDFVDENSLIEIIYKKYEKSRFDDFYEYLLSLSDFYYKKLIHRVIRESIK